jgi:hypothetical protein
LIKRKNESVLIQAVISPDIGGTTSSRFNLLSFNIIIYELDWRMLPHFHS